MLSQLLLTLFRHAWQPPRQHDKLMCSACYACTLVSCCGWATRLPCSVFGRRSPMRKAQ